jgi:hypothetical protein
MEGVKEPVTPEEFIDGLYGNAQYLSESRLADLKQEARDFVDTYYRESPIPEGITKKLTGLEEIHGGL